MATSSVHVTPPEALLEVADVRGERDHVSPDGHGFVHADENHPTVVMHTVSARVRHALFVVHDDKVSPTVEKMDGQTRRGGPGQTHVGGGGVADGDGGAREVVVTAVFLSVHDDPEHLGVDYEVYRAPLLYTWGRS